MDCLELMVLCLRNYKNLNEDFQRFLFEQNLQMHEHKQFPESLQKNLEWALIQLCIRNYLKARDAIKSANYDERSYLLTQSELLQGGMSTSQIDFFSEASNEKLRFYAKLTNN